MHCEKFEARLQELLDQRRLPEADAALLAHAEQCDTCRETLLVQEQLFAGLELREVPTLPGDFSQRVVELAAVRSAPARRDRSSPTAAWVALSAAVAASLLIVVWAVQARRESPAPQPVLAESVVPQPEVVSPDAIATPEQAVVETQQVAVRTPLPLDPQLFAVESGLVVRNLARLPDEESVERIPGLKPIASSFNQAISVVLRTLPGGRDSSPATREPKDVAPLKPQADFTRFSDAEGLI